MFDKINEINYIDDKSLNNQKFNEYYSYSMNNKKENIFPLKSKDNKYLLYSSYINNNNNNEFNEKMNITEEYLYKYKPNLNNNKNVNSNIINDNNYEQILSSISINNKNISVNSQISQDIDKQKQKFDQMLEKVKNINNSVNFEFDIKKYLPKESFLENSKALRKYKDLIKPNNSNKYNYLSNGNNFEKQLDYNDDIKENSLSEIPIKNENMFEDELSKSELNFNIESPTKNKLNNNSINNRESIKDIKNTNNKEINFIRQNLLNNIDENNILNNKNSSDENIKNNKIKLNNNNLNDIINESQNNCDNYKKDEYDGINVVKYLNNIPFFGMYYEKINDEYEEINSEDNINNLNEIEKTNLQLIKDNINLNNNKFSGYSWYCLNFFNEENNNIYNEFFNSDKI